MSKGRSSYIEPTLEVLEALFKEEQRGYQQTEIAEKVAESLNKVAGINYSDDEEEKDKETGGAAAFTKKSVQSRVSNALKTLIKEDKIVEIEPKRYIPNEKKAVRAMMKKELIREIKYTRPDMFRISLTTFLLPVQESSMIAAKISFQKYLGNEACYDIVSFNGYLMLLIFASEEECDELYDEIREIVEDGYAYEPPKRKQKLKMKEVSA